MTTKIGEQYAVTLDIPANPPISWAGIVGYAQIRDAGDVLLYDFGTVAGTIDGSGNATIIFNAQSGDLEGIIGSPGGSAIIQYTTKAILGMTDWGLNIQQAINLPNFGAQTNATTSLEKGSLIDTAAIRDGLKARGHTVAQSDAFTSGLHGVVYNGLRSNGAAGLLSRNPVAGTYAGGADPRREGTAQGNN